MSENVSANEFGTLTGLSPEERLASEVSLESPAGPVTLMAGLPPGRRVELPGRGTTFVRDLAGPPGAPTVVLIHGLLGHRRPQLVRLLRPSHPALPGRRPRPPGPRPGHPVPSAFPPGGLRRRRRRGGRRPRPCAGSCPSAIRWAARSPSWCGGATATRVEGLVLCATARNFGGRFRFRGLFEFQAVVRCQPRHASDAAGGATVAGRTSCWAGG